MGEIKVWLWSLKTCFSHLKIILTAKSCLEKVQFLQPEHVVRMTEDQEVQDFSEEHSHGVLLK